MTLSHAIPNPETLSRKGNSLECRVRRLMT
jgi:hypothetical protein